jgi:hypothetical protein
MASTRSASVRDACLLPSEGGAIDTSKSPDNEVIEHAERIVYREEWRICEERAAERLAHTSSLKWTRLFPESPAIQVVAIDGVVLGQVWHNGRWWIATEKGLAGPPTATRFETHCWPWRAKRSPGDSHRNPLRPHGSLDLGRQVPGLRTVVPDMPDDSVDHHSVRRIR